MAYTLLHCLVQETASRLPAKASICPAPVSVLTAFALQRVEATARVGNHHFGRVSALPAHTKVPHGSDFLWKTLRTLNRPGRARTIRAGVHEIALLLTAAFRRVGGLRGDAALNELACWELGPRAAVAHRCPLDRPAAREGFLSVLEPGRGLLCGRMGGRGITIGWLAARYHRIRGRPT